MVYGMIFYQAQDDKYITKISDSEHIERKEWGSLENAQKYIRKKMKENENKGWRE